MYGVQTQVDVGKDGLGGTDDRSKLLEAVGLQTGLQLRVEDRARLLGIGGDIDDVDVFAVGEAEVGVWITPCSIPLPAIKV